MKLAKLSSRLRFLAQQCAHEAQQYPRLSEIAQQLRSRALECAQTARAIDNGVGSRRRADDLIDLATDDIVESGTLRATDLAIDAVIHG